MYDIISPTCLSAWQQGAKKLHDAKGELFNLITKIETPEILDNIWLEKHSPHSEKFSKENISDVIDTIFPISLSTRYRNRTELYSNYMIRHKRAMKWKRNRGRWGTYFERLIAFGRVDKINQLERVIEKLNKWEQRNTTGLVFHLSCPISDAPRTRGGPCWHFGEIIWNADNTLDLVVVYRNHDFYNKALGNFIGLGQLLYFIATSSNKKVGKLICHSVHAYSDQSTKNLIQLAKI